MNFILKCNGFEKYIIEKNKKFFGIQYLFKFDNSYGASVIKHKYSHGYEEDEWELAVIKYCNTDCWDIVYDTKVASDIIGWLTNNDVLNLLKQIKDL